MHEAEGCTQRVCPIVSGLMLKMLFPFKGVQPENKGKLTCHAARQPEPGGDAQADSRLVLFR